MADKKADRMPAWRIHFHATVDLRDQELLTLIARVEALAHMTNSIPLPPTLRVRLDRLNILRAVRGTTGIEGSDLSEDEVERVLDAPEAQLVLGESRRREEREVRNAQRVMAYIRRRLREDPERLLLEEDVRAIHRLTTTGIDYPNNVPGEYRTVPVVAGEYMPPPPQAVADLMERFFEWFPTTATGERGELWAEPIRAVAAHFYMISIHPFGDGNGRASRGVESYVLYRSGINSLGFYSLANFYYLHRTEYVEMLDRARFVHDGDLTELAKFSLEGLRTELEAVHAEALYALKEIAFRDYAREKLQTDGSLRTKTGERRLKLVQLIMREPTSVYDLRSGRAVASALYEGVTAKTLSRDLNYLTRESGLLIVEDGEVKANLDAMNRFMDEAY